MAAGCSLAFAADFTLDDFSLNQTATSMVSQPLLGQRSMETHYFYSEPGSSSELLYTNSGKLNFVVDSVNGGYGNVQYLGSSFGPLLNLGAYNRIKLDVDKVSGEFDVSLLLQSVDHDGYPWSAYYSGIHLTSASDGHSVFFNLLAPNNPSPHFDRSRLYVAVLTISSSPGHGAGAVDFDSMSAVPEPVSLVALGGGMLALLRRRSRG